MSSELWGLFVAMGQAVLPVLAERYPAVPQMAGEVILISAALSRLVKAAKGKGKVGGFFGQLGKMFDFLGFNRG